MLQHIVMFKIKSEHPASKKQELTGILKQKLEALPAQIKEIKHFEVGMNISSSENAGDLVLVSTFANQTDLEVYRQHPAHQDILVDIKAYTESIKVVDYLQE